MTEDRAIGLCGPLPDVILLAFCLHANSRSEMITRSQNIETRSVPGCERGHDAALEQFSDDVILAGVADERALACLDSTAGHLVIVAVVMMKCKHV